MWAAIAVASVAIVIAVMSFRSRTYWIAEASKLLVENIQYEETLAALLQEIGDLAAGDHGLEHDDMADVLRGPLPGPDR